MDTSAFNGKSETELELGLHAAYDELALVDASIPASIKPVLLLTMSMILIITKLGFKGVAMKREVMHVIAKWPASVRTLWKNAMVPGATDAALDQLAADIAADVNFTTVVCADSALLLLDIDVNGMMQKGKANATPVGKSTEGTAVNKEEEKKNSQSGLNPILSMLKNFTIMQDGPDDKTYFGAAINGPPKSYVSNLSVRQGSNASLEAHQKMFRFTMAKDADAAGMSDLEYKMPGTKEVFKLYSEHYFTKSFRDDIGAENCKEPVDGGKVFDDIPPPNKRGNRDAREWLALFTVLAVMTGPYRNLAVSEVPLLWIATIIFDSLKDLVQQIQVQNSKNFFDSRFCASEEMVRLFAPATAANPSSFSPGPAYSGAIGAKGAIRSLSFEAASGAPLMKSNPSGDTSDPKRAFCFNCGYTMEHHPLNGKSDIREAMKNCPARALFRHYAFAPPYGNATEPPKLIKKQ